MREHKRLLGYTPIRVSELPIDQPLPFALYVRSNLHGQRPVLYRSPGSIIGHKVQQQLVVRGIHELLMSEVPSRRRELDAPRKYTSPQQEKQERLRSQATRTYSHAVEAVQKLLKEPLSAESLSDACDTVELMVEEVLEEDSLLAHLTSLTAHDYYTYTHSVNVCIYSLALAHRTGYTDVQKLKAIAIGGMLHDLGKSDIEVGILRKPGPLNEVEWKTMKQHPLKGADLLLGMDQVIPSAIVGVLQHHEHFDGAGYPQRLKGDTIHRFGRIICVADVFDALTTSRSYRRAFPRSKALHLMATEMRGHFEPSLLLAFVHFIAEDNSGK